MRAPFPSHISLIICVTRQKSEMLGQAAPGRRECLVIDPWRSQTTQGKKVHSGLFHRPGLCCSCEEGRLSGPGLLKGAKFLTPVCLSINVPGPFFLGVGVGSDLHGFLRRTHL